MNYTEADQRQLAQEIYLYRFTQVYPFMTDKHGADADWKQAGWMLQNGRRHL